MEYKFTVSGTPVAKARPKFSNMFRCSRCSKYFRTQKDGNNQCPQCGSRKFVVITNVRASTKSGGFETSVHMAFTVTHGAVIPTDAGVKLFIRAFFPPPKATPQYRKKEIEEGLIPVLKKPDADNVAKSVLDALNTIVYTDDKLVYRLSVEKYYSFRPRTEVVVITEGELKKEELPF